MFTKSKIKLLSFVSVKKKNPTSKILRQSKWIEEWSWNRYVEVAVTEQHSFSTVWCTVDAQQRRIVECQVPPLKQSRHRLHYRDVSGHDQISLNVRKLSMRLHKLDDNNSFLCIVHVNKNDLKHTKNSLYCNSRKHVYTVHITYREFKALFAKR